MTIEFAKALRDWRFYVFGGLFLFNLFFVAAFAAPARFPEGDIVTLRKGAGLAELADELERQGVVRSALWFRAAVIALGGERGVQAGDYYLEKRQNGAMLAWRMVKGRHDLALIKLTIPEGYTDKQISTLFDSRFAAFDKTEFLALAKEGRMFPDTYFVQENVGAEDAVQLFESNFEKKFGPLRGEIAGTGFTDEEILTLASIIESEARTKEDREIISAILQKRLKLGMALQVDASLAYVTGRASGQLTQSDLASDTPYNTYKYPGLPPGPISNPGLESIEAAIHPTTTPYLYFLTGDDGKMHYARTLEEHAENKRQYIK